jgi:hypothetical protein
MCGTAIPSWSAPWGVIAPSPGRRPSVRPHRLHRSMRPGGHEPAGGADHDGDANRRDAARVATLASITCETVSPVTSGGPCVSRLTPPPRLVRARSEASSSAVQTTRPPRRGSRCSRGHTVPLRCFNSHEPEPALASGCHRSQLLRSSRSAPSNRRRSSVLTCRRLTPSNAAASRCDIPRSKRAS